MYLQAHAKALAELRRQVGENVTTDAEAVMCNFAERLAKDARLHHEVEAIVATALLSHKGVAELREVCTQWFKRQALPFVEEMTNVVMKELQRCRDADVSLDNWRKRTEIAESPDKNETPEPSSRR